MTVTRTRRPASSWVWVRISSQVPSSSDTGDGIIVISCPLYYSRDDGLSGVSACPGRSFSASRRESKYYSGFFVHPYLSGNGRHSLLPAATDRFFLHQHRTCLRG